MYNNLISQAGQMQLSGVPNDLLSVMAGAASVAFGPPIQLLYNFLAARKIPFGPILRISTAFVICAGGMAYASGLQKIIYDSGPCYDAPLACGASDGGRLPNEVNVWLQVPIYVIIAIAEIFGLVTASQYAYEKAPKGMRGVVQATVQLSAGLGAILAIAISPAAKDPHLIAMYGALAGTTGLCSVVFWGIFRKYDESDDEMNRLNQEESESDLQRTRDEEK
jgi:proton-dependent oligopeptide transporter, POT family